MILADPSFLYYRILGATFVGVAPIAKEIQYAVRECGQGGHEVLRQPTHEEMHMPISGFEQAAKAPRGEGGGRPLSHLRQGLAPGRDGLHEDEPAEDEAMATASYGGHAAKNYGHKAGQIGEGDQHGQSPLQKREREKSY